MLLCFSEKEFYFTKLFPNTHRRTEENNRGCEICSIDIHRATYAKHLRSKRHLEYTGQDEIFIPEWLFEEEQTPVKKNIQP